MINTVSGKKIMRKVDICGVTIRINKVMLCVMACLMCHKTVLKMCLTQFPSEMHM